MDYQFIAEHSSHFWPVRRNFWSYGTTCRICKNSCRNYLELIRPWEPPDTSIWKRSTDKMNCFLVYKLWCNSQECYCAIRVTAPRNLATVSQVFTKRIIDSHRFHKLNSTDWKDLLYKLVKRRWEGRDNQRSEAWCHACKSSLSVIYRINKSPGRIIHNMNYNCTKV